MKKALIALIVLFPLLSQAQYVRRDGVVWLPNGLPASGASIYIGQNGATGVPLSPLATVYCNSTGTVAAGCSSPGPIANPVTADSNGNYHYYTVPGKVCEQMTVQGQTSTTCDILIPGDPSQSATLDVRSYGGYPSGTLDQWLNAANSACVSSGGGSLDARGLAGLTETIAAQISIGNSAGLSCTLLLPPAFNWQISGITNGTSCGIKVFTGSSVIGTDPSGASKGQITAAGSVIADSMVCSDASTLFNYVRVEGFMLYNTNGATFAHGLLYAVDLVDGSLIKGMIIANYATNGDGLRVYGGCCTARFEGIVSNANYTGGRPVFISSDLAHSNFGLVFDSLSAGHSGPGWADVEISSSGITPPTDGVNKALVFNNLYTELSAGITTSALKIVDARGVLVNGWMCGVIAGGAGSKCLDLSQSGANQVRDIQIHGFYYGQSSGSTGLSNSITGEAICGSSCYVPSYIYGGSTGGGQSAANSVIVDNEQDWKNAAGNTVYQFPVNGNFAVRNFADAGMFWVFDTGVTAQQNEAFQYRDRGANQWQFGKGTSNDFGLSDLANGGLQRYYAVQNSNNFINAGAGANAIRMNSSPNSATGGTSFWSGGASPTLVASIDGSGNIAAGAGANVVLRCVTAGALPIGALTITAGNCGTSTDTGLRVK